MILDHVPTQYCWQWCDLRQCLQLVMSSDKLATLNEPLLNVDLDLQDGTGDSRQVAVELTHDDLKKLLNSLEGCSKVVVMVVDIMIMKNHMGNSW